MKDSFAALRDCVKMRPGDFQEISHRIAALEQNVIERQAQIEHVNARLDAAETAFKDFKSRYYVERADLWKAVEGLKSQILRLSPTSKTRKRK